uniref:Transmembrane protein 65 n=1 Tax=Plectus sambesii TaxID=2011161 RepID=A0A914XEW3_9BILA
MFLIPSRGLLASSSTKGGPMQISATPVRRSTSGANIMHDHAFQSIKITQPSDANDLADHLTPAERRLLFTALEARLESSEVSDSVTREQLKALLLVNTLPFIGFGVLDNMIMLLAGEYIDTTLGIYLGISTMAAAALGNTISDVAGVGLSHYVEFLVQKFGIRAPALTSDQLHLARVRYTANFGRALGLVVGCIIGMFPLLFFKDQDEKEKNRGKEKEEKERGKEKLLKMTAEGKEKKE